MPFYLREPAKVTGTKDTLAANEFARTQEAHKTSKRKLKQSINMEWVNDIIFGGSNEANNDVISQPNNLDQDCLN